MKGIKKIITGVLAVTCLTSAVAFSACGDDNYTATPLTGYEETKNAPVESNGGFAVKKGSWIYFINGTQYYTASNEYGDAVRGSLMRISETNFNAGNYTQAEIVVPQLFVAQDYDAGIFIYGDYVYYATPTTDKDMETGEAERTKIDFKRAKLDGSETMKGYYFRLDNNTSNYRYVEENGVVYCLYEEDTTLKSYNTVTGVTSVLVKGATSSYYYDTDVTDGKVYYTMAVTKGTDTDNPVTMDYNQVYCVSASATATVDAEKASYTTSNGDTYNFDEYFMQKKNEEAKEKAEENDEEVELPYDFEDYSTYPYVNLGELVLDGCGQFDGATNSPSLGGYTYTLTTYQNGGVYFAREELLKTGSDQETGDTYYISDIAKDADGYNAVTANATLKEVDGDGATSSAIFTENAGVITYYYNVSGSIYKHVVGGKTIMLTNANNALSKATLWKVDGDYLYFYSENSNGNNIGRINVTGKESNYQEAMLGEMEEYTTADEYRPQIITFVDWNMSWYKPEIFGEILLYSNVQSFGDKSYNYIYATKLDSVKEVKERIADYNAVYEEINKAKGTALQNAMTYYFRTGKTEAYDSVKEEVYSATQQKAFDEFKAKFEGDAPEFVLESEYFTLMGKWSDEDATEINQSWVDLLTPEKDATEEESGLPTWAIILISVGSALVVGVAAFIVIRKVRRAKAKKREEEATVNAYKRKKIDTTDDKSIDVYADENAEEISEESEKSDETEE